MFEILGKVAIGLFLGVILIVISESMSSGGPIIKGTKKYNKVNKDSDARVKETLKKGSGSSKQELQKWWDAHHK